MEIIYHNESETIAGSILLNQIQPVSYARCIKKVGSIDYGLMHLISQRFYNCINKFSIEKAIQKFMEPALRAYNYESEKALNAYSQNEKLQIFLNMLHIPEHLKLLRLSFIMTLSVKEVSLKNIIALIQQNCDAFTELKENTIEKKLRAEFLDWINMNNSNIIAGYEKISLIHFLKIFAKLIKL